MNIGIIGGGQLARMMMLAGYPLGFRFVALDPAANACAAPLGKLIQADYDDERALRELAAWADVVTFEFENVPDKSLRFLSEHLPVFPPAHALSLSQDRLKEKELFRELGIPTPKFKAVDCLSDLTTASDEFGLPLILKTRKLGYDGKGQIRIHSRDAMASACEILGKTGLIVEEFVRFEREVSIIAVRSRAGHPGYYPLSENTHGDGILRWALSRPEDPKQSIAEQYIDRILARLDYVGILALELFERNGELLANEIAPRVHNSGHWTIEGAEISQFENHLRAVAGLPTGSTAAKGYSAMVNFIGALPAKSAVLAHPEIHFHAYGKDPRPGRKVGHATVNASSLAQLHNQIKGLLEISGASNPNELETPRCGSDRSSS